MNTGFQLYQLQEIDSSIDTAKKRMIEIDQLVVKKEEINQYQKKLSQSEAEFKQKKIIIDQLSNEIELKRIKKNQSESSLYAGSIINPKELQDLQLEISSLGQSINKMEDELLEKMIDLEEVQGHYKELQGSLQLLQSEFDTRKSMLLGEKAELEDAIKKLSLKRVPIISQINKDELNIYDLLRSKKNGIAVAKLQDDSCSSCGSFLTASQCQQARSAIQLFFCPSCGRIVYGS